MNDFASDMTLLILPNGIKALGVVDKNADEVLLSPIIKKIQDSVIRDLLGPDHYQKLLTLVRERQIYNEGNECYLELLKGYIMWIIAWHAKAQYVIDSYLRMLNAAAVNVNDDDPEPVAYDGVKQAAADIRAGADHYIEGLRTFLSSGDSCLDKL